MVALQSTYIDESHPFLLAVGSTLVNRQWTGYLSNQSFVTTDS